MIFALKIFKRMVFCITNDELNANGQAKEFAETVDTLMGWELPTE